ncbi:MAG TPA: hypothetical protein VGL23_10195 [Chloroflexota bacterium]|jgi:hypothetical protein
MARQAIGYMIVFVGLAINAALSMLLAHAIIPSLVTTDDAPRDVLLFRRILYPIAAASLALTLYALAQALGLIVALLQYAYPRFAL